MRVGIIFGGKSGEHEVSLRSAKSIANAIDRKKHQVFLIGIDKEGLWCRSDESLSLYPGIPFLEACGDLLKNLDVRSVARHTCISRENLQKKWMYV